MKDSHEFDSPYQTIKSSLEGDIKHLQEALALLIDVQGFHRSPNGVAEIVKLIAPEIALRQYELKQADRITHVTAD